MTKGAKERRAGLGEMGGSVDRAIIVKTAFAYALLAQRRCADRFSVFVGPVVGLFLQNSRAPVPGRATCLEPDGVASRSIRQ